MQPGGAEGTLSHGNLPANDKQFFQLDVGMNHACGVTGKGVLYCWGKETYGILGNGNGGSADSPTQVDLSQTGESNLVFSKVATGTAQSCAISKDGKPFCWGKAWIGMSSQQSPAPVDLSNLSGDDRIFTDIGVGDAYTCGLSKSQKIFCWGSYSEGRLGNSEITANQSAPLTPVAGTMKWEKMYVGYDNVCAIDLKRKLYCWGNGNYGNGGWGDLSDRSDPVPVAMGGVETANQEFSRITVGRMHTCGISFSGETYCFGEGLNGKLGHGGSNNAIYAPSETYKVDKSSLGTGEHFVKIALADRSTCGFTNLHFLYCWGENTVGQLGNGTSDVASSIPALVTGVNPWDGK